MLSVRQRLLIRKLSNHHNLQHPALPPKRSEYPLTLPDPQEMSSHVVVIDTTFRRTTIKVTPGKFLTDVLEEACGKLGLKASNYGLKYVLLHLLLLRRLLTDP